MRAGGRGGSFEAGRYWSESQITDRQPFISEEASPREEEEEQQEEEAPLTVHMCGSLRRWGGVGVGETW